MTDLPNSTMWSGNNKLHTQWELTFLPLTLINKHTTTLGYTDTECHGRKLTELVCTARAALNFLSLMKVVKCQLQQTSNVSAAGKWRSQLKSTSVGCGFCRSILHGTGTKINCIAKTNYSQLMNLNHFLSSEVANIKWSSKFGHPVLLIM